MNIHAASIISRKIDIAFTNLDDELLAIDAQTGYCYSMNDTAGEVWEILSAPMTFNDLCSRLCDEFDVDEGTCHQEVLMLLNDLWDAGLIEVEHGQFPAA